MKKNKNTILYLSLGIMIGIIISLTILFFLDKYVISDDNELDKNNVYEDYNNVENNIEDDNNVENNIEDDNNSYEDDTNNNVTDNNNSNQDEDLNNENTNVSPVSFFENVEKSKDENVLKEGFIKIVDFLFYDGTINGYRFDDLTSEAKLKIMKIALSLDKKIDEYFPGYKESISSGAKKAYNSVKSFVVELYLDTTSKICTNDPQLCKYAKEDFAYMKEAFGITWDFIKNLANSGVDKLKEWYEIFRES